MNQILAIAEQFPLDEFLRVSGPPTTWKENKHIWQGEFSPGLYMVQSGLVRRYRLIEDGTVLHLGFHVKGECFGESFLTQTPERAVAMEKCELLHWPGSELVFRGDLHLMGYLMPLFAQRLIETEERLALMNLKIQKRLRVALEGLSQKAGIDCDRGIVLPRITHPVLAGIVGTSREIVSTHLNKFKREGLLSYDHKKQIVLSPTWNPDRNVKGAAA